MRYSRPRATIESLTGRQLSACRGQAAMEFLATYGWAVLIMLVVVAVLFYSGVFNAPGAAPSSCVLPAGLTCSEFRVDDFGTLYLDLGQATGKPITVTGVGCGSSSDPTVWPASVSIPSGGHANVTGAGIPCSGAQAGTFKGTLVVTYMVAGSGLERTARGTVSTQVQYGNALSLSGPGWNSSFQYFRPVILNTGVPSNLTDFPAYFAFDSASLIATGKMNASCRDVRVISSDNQTMDFEIEANSCNTTSTIVWARIPQTPASQNYHAYLYYGNATAPDAQNKTGVWKNGFAVVYHLADLSDSTGSTSGTNTGGIPVAGTRGGAYYFDGASHYVSISYSSVLNVTTQCTVTAWINKPVLIAWNDSWKDYHLITYLDNTSCGLPDCASGGSQFSFHFDKNTLYGKFDSAATSSQKTISASVPSNAWTHVALLLDVPNLTLFVAGAQANTRADLAGYLDLTAANPTRIGAFRASTTYFNGTIDELRIARTARSSDWIAAEAGQSYGVGSERQNT